jgi:hypothetical protein
VRHGAQSKRVEASIVRETEGQFRGGVGLQVGGRAGNDTGQPRGPALKICGRRDDETVVGCSRLGSKKGSGGRPDQWGNRAPREQQPLLLAQRLRREQVARTG